MKDRIFKFGTREVFIKEINRLEDIVEDQATLIDEKSLTVNILHDSIKTLTNCSNDL